MSPAQALDEVGSTLGDLLGELDHVNASQDDVVRLHGVRTREWGAAGDKALIIHLIPNQYMFYTICICLYFLVSVRPSICVCLSVCLSILLCQYLAV